MEAWAVDAETPRGPLSLLVRRAAGGRIYRQALPLAQEFRVFEAAWEGGVRVPRPYRYFSDVAGREAFAMERLAGETVGRRIVQKPELSDARAALPAQMAEQLARIPPPPAPPPPVPPPAPGRAAPPPAPRRLPAAPAPRP